MVMKQELQDALSPIIDFLDGLDPSDAGAAALLNETFPVGGDAMQKLATLFEKGVADASLCDREGGPGVRYSRVAKAVGKSEFSIDAVRMDRPGPGHSHPHGEFDLCFAVAGEPKFDEQEPGWTVYEPGSWHVPTVRGGTMNILYFLPGGAIEFGPRAE
jgi:2-hydroxylaminobenzoate mutase